MAKKFVVTKNDQHECHPISLGTDWAFLQPWKPGKDGIHAHQNNPTMKGNLTKDRLEDEDSGQTTWISVHEPYDGWINRDPTGKL